MSLDEVTSLAEHLNQDVESLRFADLAVEGRDVLLENLRFLLHTLDHGGKKELASFVGIDPTTVSRWRRGTHPPQGPSLQVIVRYFGLPPETDLREEPVFLVASPIVTTEGKRWLHDRIEALSPDELRGLFPALRRLLSDK